jgi:hypothetical protein
MPRILALVKAALVKAALVKAVLPAAVLPAAVLPAALLLAAWLVPRASHAAEINLATLSCDKYENEMV